MSDNVKIKIDGTGKLANVNEMHKEIEVKMAVAYGFTEKDDDEVDTEIFIGGAFHGKKKFASVLGEAVARSIMSIADDDPAVLDAFEAAYDSERKRLTDQKTAKMREEIMRISPFSKEMTEELLDGIKEAARKAATSVPEEIGKMFREAAEGKCS